MYHLLLCTVIDANTVQINRCPPMDYDDPGQFMGTLNTQTMEFSTDGAHVQITDEERGSLDAVAENVADHADDIPKPYVFHYEVDVP